MGKIQVKRIYEPASKEDGFRILVDRLWPRGMPKEKAKLDLWLKDIAPSDELRKWFGHDPAKWGEFRKRYIQEVKNKKDTFDRLKAITSEEKTVTFLYAARDTEHNEALVIKDLLK